MVYDKLIIKINTFPLKIFASPPFSNIVGNAPENNLRRFRNFYRCCKIFIFYLN